MEKAKKFYGMSNDYMFRAVLQESEEALKEMVSKIKELSEEERIQLQCEAEEIYKWDMKSERQAGREEGLAEGRREMIANALRQGKTCEDIAEFCGIPLDDVREMERYINQNH